MATTADLAHPAASPYRDRKRYAWLLSLLVPALVGAGPWMYLATGEAGLLWLPLAVVYLLFPLLDWLLGEDTSNPPESAVPALEADRYYRYITWTLVPMLWAIFIASAWFAVSQPLPAHAWIARPASSISV